ncbi:CLUMA_CG006215, isoform A [Clunio marinus]|uniref:CLUMA_CG006215, isoform A n=1 Tax=Clunio marinus TaxID=568069 RepID=A0A1J1I1D3_9DIPT|nr:CLUMA_CG006215, isoform A [Clunio marinus]
MDKEKNLIEGLLMICQSNNLEEKSSETLKLRSELQSASQKPNMRTKKKTFRASSSRMKFSLLKK